MEVRDELKLDKSWRPDKVAHNLTGGVTMLRCQVAI